MITSIRRIDTNAPIDGIVSVEVPCHKLGQRVELKIQPFGARKCRFNKIFNK
jgi:hypothetical protein